MYLRDAGTYLLVLFGPGSVVAASLWGLSPAETLLFVAAVFGSTVACVIVGLGRFSGAHINPAISVGSAVAGLLKRELFVQYLVFQVVGAAACRDMPQGHLRDRGIGYPSWFDRAGGGNRPSRRTRSGNRWNLLPGNVGAHSRLFRKEPSEAGPLGRGDAIRPHPLHRAADRGFVQSCQKPRTFPPLGIPERSAHLLCGAGHRCCVRRIDVRSAEVIWQKEKRQDQTQSCLYVLRTLDGARWRRRSQEGMVFRPLAPEPSPLRE